MLDVVLVRPCLFRIGKLVIKPGEYAEIEDSILDDYPGWFTRLADLSLNQWPRSAFMAHTVEELEDFCCDLGLSPSGLKADLVDRLMGGSDVSDST